MAAMVDTAGSRLLVSQFATSASQIDSHRDVSRCSGSKNVPVRLHSVSYCVTRSFWLGLLLMPSRDTDLGMSWESSEAGWIGSAACRRRIKGHGPGCSQGEGWFEQYIVGCVACTAEVSLNDADGAKAGRSHRHQRALAGLCLRSPFNPF